MTLSLNKIIWNVLLAAFLAALFLACNKDSTSSKDKETRIVETYFLPNNEPETLVSSFKLCGTKNENAIANLAFIYGSKDLHKTVDLLIASGIEGNCSDCNDDPRLNPISEISEKWHFEIDSSNMNSATLAYEYALFQHWLYLKFTEKITDESIRSLYKDAKAKTPKPCLTSRMSKGVKPVQRPGNQEITKRQREKGNQGKSKESDQGNEDSNANWFFYASVLMLFLLEWKRGFIDILRVGHFIFGQFKKGNAPSSQTIVTNANSPSTQGNLYQTETNSNKQFNSEPRVSIHDLYTSKEKTDQDPTPSKPPLPKPKQEITEKPPFVPPALKNEYTFEKPSLAIQPEQKKEVTLEKPTLIHPSELKKPEQPPKEEAYDSSFIFARIPSGNLFFGFSSQPEYPDTPFVINERTCTYDLVNDQQTLERLFSTIDQLKDACELMNINQPSLNTYQVKVKGQVVKEGDYWRIEKKLKLDW